MSYTIKSEEIDETLHEELSQALGLDPLKTENEAIKKHILLDKIHPTYREKINKIFRNELK